jgi:hypothetical protein
MHLNRQTTVESWVVGNGILATIGFGIIQFFLFVLFYGGRYETGSFSQWLYIAISTLPTAIVFGWPQATMVYKEPQQRFQWLGLTLIGCAAGWTYLMVTDSLVTQGDEHLFIYLSSGVVFGLAIGVAQWLVLKNESEITAYHWIWGSTVAWGASAAIMVGLIPFIGWGNIFVAGIFYAVTLNFVRNLMLQKGS